MQDYAAIAEALGLDAGEAILESFRCQLLQTYRAANNPLTPDRTVRCLALSLALGTCGRICVCQHMPAHASAERMKWTRGGRGITVAVRRLVEANIVRERGILPSPCQRQLAVRVQAAAHRQSNRQKYWMTFPPLLEMYAPSAPLLNIAHIVAAVLWRRRWRLGATYTSPASGCALWWGARRGSTR